MIEADGWETVYQTAPLVDRTAMFETAVRACALEWLREVVAKATEGKRP